MADDVTGLLQEISGILQRISEQSATTCVENDLEFSEPPLQLLQQHNQQLESLIERLKADSKKA
jgi:hypothetical protein